jgi:glycosyltransferase involved in cell wall biosynthesis
MVDGRLHVCFVLPSLNGGGAERAAVKVINALDPSRFRRSLYMFRREGRYLEDVASDVEMVAAPRDDRWSRIRELSRYFRTAQPDVAVSFLSYFSTFAAAALSRRSPHVIVNLQTPMSAFLRDGDYQWRAPLKRRVFQLAVRMMYPRAAAVVATSRGVAADLTDTFRVAAARIVVIPNPIDLAEIDALSREPVAELREDGPPVIIAAGRLAEAKNYPLLIESLCILRRDHQFRAFILGEGELEGDIRRAIADAHLDADVRLCGFQPNPWKFMARADVFALTSHYEGFGNVIVEAMACGCPVVATASPGTTEIIERGKTGLIVDRHEPEAFARALAELLTDAARRKAMAQAARDAADRYALAHVVERYASLFESVAA